MFYKLAVAGVPGTGKSSVGLSFPGVQQHVFGSSEETTAVNFVGRTDILPPVKYDWFDTLTEAERNKFTDEKATELDVANLTKMGRARNVSRYRRLLYQLKSDIKAGKLPELKTVFMDNGTPFSLEFEDYIEVIYGHEFKTKEGNFDGIAYHKRYASEFIDFCRLFHSLECHTVMSFHVSMVAGEEVAANTQFMKAASMGGVKKEWQPMIAGKAKFVMASIPDFVFFMKTEESLGLPTKYIAKLEADESTIGAAKPRIQPFENPRRIEFPKNKAFDVLDAAIKHYTTTGMPYRVGGHK